jgi:DnaK suppressor protein
MPTRATTKPEKRASRGASNKAKPAAAARPKAVGTKSAGTSPKSSRSSTTTPKRATTAAPKNAKLMTAKTTASKSKAAPRTSKKAAAAKTATKTKAAALNGALTEDQIRQMSDDDYMSDAQLSFFRERLLAMRAEVLAREVDVKERLHQREVFADPADRATAEEEHWLDLRLRERESLLLRKIDEALKRIADREYGYCEKTGDPIGIPRLLARPTATVCVDIKGQDERVEAQYRDR